MRSLPCSGAVGCMGSWTQWAAQGLGSAKKVREAEGKTLLESLEVSNGGIDVHAKQTRDLSSLIPVPLWPFIAVLAEIDRLPLKSVEKDARQKEKRAGLVSWNWKYGTSFQGSLRPLLSDQ